MRHRDHYAPHLTRKFCGYYTRTQLSDGGTLVIIFSWVRNAKARKNLVLVAYIPPPIRSSGQAHASADNPTVVKPSSGTPEEGFKYEFYPERFNIAVRNSPQREGHTQFTIVAKGIGTMKVTSTTIEYDITVPEHNLDVHLVASLSAEPWDPAHPMRGPMGVTVHFSGVLPLNWHVRLTKAPASYSITHRNMTTAGIGLAHAEKNWGRSFPRGWIWAQAFSADGERSFCLAGGTALPGVHAYLAGYRSPKCQWDFRPPFALGRGILWPFMSIERDSEKGRLEVSLRTWLKRLEIKIEAAPESFLRMAAPLTSGHEPDYAHESFRAILSIEAYGRRWPWASGQSWKTRF